MPIDPGAPRLERAALWVGLALALTACSPRDQDADGTMASMMRDMPQGMMSGEGMMGPGMMRDMRPIHGLLTSHQRIERRVEDIPGGVRTITTSDDPRVAGLIRSHVRQMKARYARGQAIRMMDPVFRELFRNRHKASLEYEDVPGGIRVTHTSSDPQVALLIRQHARSFVSEAANEGMSRAMRTTPLPEGYRKPIA